MILALCQQVQKLTSQAQQVHHQDSIAPRNNLHPASKRQDTKTTPRKQKRLQEQMAIDATEEGSNEIVPMDEHHPTVWDGYDKEGHHD